MEYRLNKVDLNIRNNATPEVKQDKVHMKPKIEVGHNLIDNKNKDSQKKKESKEFKKNEESKIKHEKELKIEAERYQAIQEDFTGVFIDKRK